MRQSKKLLESLREDWASPPRFKDTLVQGVGRVDFDLGSVCTPDSSLHPSFHSPTPLTAAGGYWGAWDHGCRDFSRLATGPFPTKPIQASAPSSALSYPHTCGSRALCGRGQHPGLEDLVGVYICLSQRPWKNH